MNNVSPLLVPLALPLSSSLPKIFLFPQNSLCDTPHFGPFPTLYLFVTGSSRTPHPSLPTGHTDVGSQPPETLSRSPKTLSALEVSGELVLSQVYHLGISGARSFPLLTLLPQGGFLLNKLAALAATDSLSTGLLTPGECYGPTSSKVPRLTSLAQLGSPYINHSGQTDGGL